MKDIKIEFNCKKGFTLAETLITLGIIGVVATITIPNLIATYQKKQVATQLKESYSIIQQAVKLSQDENGEIDSWDTTLSGHDFFNKYLSNYIKWQKEYTSTELTQSAPRTLLNGTRYTGTTYTGRNSAHFTLINGSMISMNLDNANANGLWVGIDVIYHELCHSMHFSHNKEFYNLLESKCKDWNQLKYKLETLIL